MVIVSTPRIISAEDKRERERDFFFAAATFSPCGIQDYLEREPEMVMMMIPRADGREVDGRLLQ